MAVGLGGLGLALLSTVLTFIVLGVIGKIEFRVDEKRQGDGRKDG